MKDYYKRNPDKWKSRSVSMIEYQKKRDERIRKELFALIGKICILCNSNPQKIIYHEIHGKPHDTHPYYILKHYQDFVPLCHKCHRTIHHYLFLIKINESKWNDLVQPLKQNILKQ